MKLTNRHPIYLDPTDAELIELAESNWDTLRVLECSETLVIASGYGNTHSEMVDAYKCHIGKGKTKERWNPRIEKMEQVYAARVPSWDPYIFFGHYEWKTLLCNLEDTGGSSKTLPSEWRRKFSPERNRQFRLLAEFSGLSAI